MVLLTQNHDKIYTETEFAVCGGFHGQCWHGCRATRQHCSECRAMDPQSHRVVQAPQNTDISRRVPSCTKNTQMDGAKHLLNEQSRANFPAFNESYKHVRSDQALHSVYSIKHGTSRPGDIHSSLVWSSATTSNHWTTMMNEQN